MLTQKLENDLLNEVNDIPNEYFPQLIQIIHSYKEAVIKKNQVDRFSQSFEDAVLNKTKAVSTLWEDIDD